jgi:hypothetical protein
VSISAEDLGYDRGLVAAKNQSLFREVNERVKYVNHAARSGGSLGDWICECADDGCTGRVEMSVEEYEAIREDGARFFVLPGDAHVWPDIERVVSRTDRFWVVEKAGRARESAKRLDPRMRPLRVRT